MPPTPAEITAALGIDDDTDLLGVITGIEHHIAFNRLLGLEIIEISAEHARMRFRARPELIGHAGRGALHGGVVSATLDAVGGVLAMAALVQRADTTEEALASVLKLGTIDMRVDYLLPATGTDFVASAHPQRIGRTVAVTRMELHDERERVVAVGTATYIVG